MIYIYILVLFFMISWQSKIKLINKQTNEINLNRFKLVRV